MSDSETKIQAALSVLPPDRSRDEWVQVGMAIQDELGEAGWPIFDEWSARDPDSYNLSEARNTWKSFRQGKGTGLGSLMKLAKAANPNFNASWKGQMPTPEEIAKRAAERAERQKLHEAEEAIEEAEAAIRAQKRLDAAVPATDDYPYLKKKGVKAHDGLRVGSWWKWDPVTDSQIELQNTLLLPVKDVHGKIWSLQGITENGDKYLLSGGAKKGKFLALGTPKPNVEGNLVYGFAEGYATAASAHELTGIAVLYCYDVGNMVRLVREVREKKPAAELIIFADNDTKTEAKRRGNPGMKAAFRIGMEYDAAVVFAPGGGDFNDLVQEHGSEAAQAAFDARVVPTAAYAPPTPRADAIGVKPSAETHGESDHGDTTRPLPSPPPIAAAAALVLRPADMLPANLPKSADARDGSPRYFALTEKGNSYRLAIAEGQNMRFVTDLNQFLFWSDGRWTPDHGDFQVRSAIGRLPKAIREEATEHVYDDSPDDASYALKWAQKSEAASTIANTVTLLKDIGALHVRFQEVDANPLLVGFDGGRKVVDLRDGAVRDAQRADLVTRSLGINAVGSSSEAVLWRNFLAQIFSDDVELIDYMHRWIGYSLTGCYTEQMFLFLQGAGANGKSVLVKVLRALFGGYGAVVAAGTLMDQQRTGKEASPDVLGMAGARILLASEVAQNEAFDERFLKGWTGGDLQKARPLHGKNVDFEPVGKLMIAGNHRPRIVGTDPAVWRRVRLVPFKRQFSEAERDATLTDRLIAELPHIAAWAIAGCLEWARRGLADTPKAVKIASADYAKEQDTLGEFLHERTDEGGECTTHDLFGEYKHWAEACNIRAISRQAFGRKLGERGFTLKHTRNGTVAENISLRRRPF